MAKKHSMIIKNLIPTLTERGKIKIGEKGKMTTSRQGNDFQQPKKLDHFRIVTLRRGEDGNYIKDNAVHKLYGDTPMELPVRLLYDEIVLNFQCRYACYKKRIQWCSGDGEIATRLNEETGEIQNFPCPCHRQQPDYNNSSDKCKINGCLSVLIDGVESIGGVWKFRTTGYNSVTGILSSLTLIKSVTGGPLAGIPLSLIMAPKTVVSPTDGRTQTVYVVGIEYKGTFEALEQIGYDKAMSRQKHLVKMEDIEGAARKLLEATAGCDIVDQDVVEEFYPEQYGPVNGSQEAKDLTEQIKNGATKNAGIKYGEKTPTPGELVDAEFEPEKKEEPDKGKPNPKGRRALFDKIMASDSMKGLVLGNRAKVEAMPPEKQAQLKAKWDAKGGLGEWPIKNSEGGKPSDIDGPGELTEAEMIEAQIEEVLAGKSGLNEKGYIHVGAFQRFYGYFEDRLGIKDFEEITEKRLASVIPAEKREPIVQAFVRALAAMKVKQELS